MYLHQYLLRSLPIRPPNPQHLRNGTRRSSRHHDAEPTTAHVLASQSLSESRRGAEEFEAIHKVIESVAAYGGKTLDVAQDVTDA